MSGGMNAARNLRIASRSNGVSARAANIQSGAPDCKASGRSILAVMPLEAANVVTTIAIGRVLAGIFVVAVLRCAEVRSVQHYAEHRSSHIRENLHASS